MAYTVIESSRFVMEYDGIIRYLMDKLKSPQAALGLIDGIDRAISLLSETPYINAISLKDPLEEKSYREMLVKNYVLVYRIDEDGGDVFIVDIFHQSQNYGERLSDRSAQSGELPKLS